MHRDNQPLQWPPEGVTRAPYRVMADPGVYQLEQQRIFRGPTWNYLCLEVEIPDPGCYRTTHVGDTPVIVNRGTDGSVNALVNRCSHKGALLCVDAGGSRQNISCVYHGWSYDLDGNLAGIAFQNGVNGRGGMPPDFDPANHGLERLRVESFEGVVFATFSWDVESLEAYLCPAMTAHMRRIFHKPIEVLGYHHQTMENNWKLYMENSRDPYHATILHAFYTTFRLNRLTMDGGLIVDHDGWNTINFSKGATDTEGGYESGQIRSLLDGVTLEDRSLIRSRPEFDDGITVAIQSIFPTCVNQQIYNTLALRQVIPRAPDRTELHWTFFGYADDDPELRAMRLKQSNLIGPAGYVSMEDGVIGEYVQRGIQGAGLDEEAIMLMGGSSVESTTGARANETTLRGFWTGYRSVMGF